MTWLIVYLPIGSRSPETLWRSPWLLAPEIALCAGLCLSLVRSIFAKLRRMPAVRPDWLGFGQDLAHAGLLVVLLSAAIGPWFRQEAELILAEGEKKQLLGGYELEALRAEPGFHPSGRISSWTVALRLGRSGETGREGRAGINRPWDSGGLRLCLVSWRMEDFARFASPDGEPIRFVRGEGWTEDGWSYGLRDLDDTGRALIDAFEGTQAAAKLVLAPGQTAGRLKLESTGRVRLSGLVVSRDPAWPAAAAGLAVCALGLALCAFRISRRRPGPDRDHA